MLRLLVLAFFVAQAAAQCFIQPDGTMPAPGMCTGPVARIALRRSNMTLSNFNCPINQVPYYPDGDPSAPIKCGECRPESSGDDERNCGINDYCTDDGHCRHLRLSPFYGKPCPYDGGMMCGPGLSCIQHKCVICEEGVYDPTDGKMCHSGQWTYSEWDTMSSNPQAVFLLIVMILLIISLIRPLFVRKGAWKKGYFFKLLRKNGRTKKLAKMLDNKIEWAFNTVFKQAEREDSRRRRRGSVPIPPSTPRTSTSMSRSEVDSESEGLESENEVEMYSIKTSSEVSFSVATVGTQEPALIRRTAEMVEPEAKEDGDSDHQEEWNGQDEELADKNGDTETKGKTKPTRRRAAGDSPGKFIPTLARPRQFGYYTTKEEWEAAEQANHQQ